MWLLIVTFWMAGTGDAVSLFEMNDPVACFIAADRDIHSLESKTFHVRSATCVREKDA